MWVYLVDWNNLVSVLFSSLSFLHYCSLPCARMRSRVMRLVASVCVRICIYVCQQKNRLFSALPLENLLLSVMHCLLFKFKRLQCSLLCPASCTDWVFLAFPNKTCSFPWPQIIFFWTLMAHHTLWAKTRDLAAVVYTGRDSASVSEFQFLCYYS